MSSITAENGYLLWRTPYNPALVAALKTAIPASDRRFEGDIKAWKVAPQHGQTLVRLTEQYLGETVRLPAVGTSAVAKETRILEVRYLGATKDRGDGNRSAFGLVDGVWAVIFPEAVLREWFNAAARPDEEATLYAVLGVPQAVEAAELKSAYRRLARTWHPDVCREIDAKEQFQRIQHAYDVLKEPRLRARYDAGLALTASLKPGRLQQGLESIFQDSQGYRSPLRCGLIMAEGHDTLGRFVVEKILTWQDITDGYGRTLVVSWPRGADEPVEQWS